MYPNGNNFQQLPYSPENDPVVAQDYAIRYNAVQEAREKENIKNQGAEQRERTKLEYKLRADELKKREKHQELTGYHIINLDGKITYIKYVYGNPVGVVLFEGIIKEVRRITWESSVLGYQFLVKTNSDECWTDMMPGRYLDNFDDVVIFLEKYMVFHRPQMSISRLSGYFVDYLKLVSCNIVQVPYYTGWYERISCDNRSGKAVNRYQYIFHGQLQSDEYESALIKRSTLCHQQGTVENTIYDVISLFVSLEDRKNAGILFLYHVSTVLRYFVGYPMFEKKLLLLGNKQQICRAGDYLKVLHTTDADYIVASNMKDFEYRLMCYPDDCALILLDGCSAHLKSRVMDVVDNSIFKERIGLQTRKTVPVFLLGQIPKELDTDSFIIVDLQDLSFENSSEKIRNVLGSFDKYIFDIVYHSGEHWPGKLKKMFDIRLQKERENKSKTAEMTAAFKMTARFIYDLLLEANVREETRKYMDSLISYGISKLDCINTLSVDSKIVFLNMVQSAVEKREICFCSRINVPDEADYSRIAYYDTKFYYFPQQLMKDMIFYRMDSGSRLDLLRELKDEDILHCHNVKNNGYLISIKLTTVSGNKNVVSVYAISRSFFESAYGIKLYERG